MTQQACVISNLSLSFPTQSIFQNISFSLFAHQTSAMIGRNGQGKSLLMHLLHENRPDISAYTGQIHWQIPHAYLSQLNHLDSSNETTIAQVLKIEHLYQAFQHVEQGSANFDDYDLLENKWHLPALWETQLKDANLPTQLDFKVKYLSEGQKTKLALCHLFLQTDHYLLLDEPSNHLDLESRQWLIQKIDQHASGVFIISHDQVLLRQVDHIYALSQLGLQHVCGNYEDYKELSMLKTHALAQRIDQQKRDLKAIHTQQNEQLLKMQKKSGQAKKLRQSGSQPKMVLNAKKSQAEQSLASIQKQQVRQSCQIQTELSKQQNEYEIIKPQQFYFKQNAMLTGEMLRINHLRLPYGTAKPVHLALQADYKIHLKGHNGAGKSTLLKLIQKAQSHDVASIFLKAQLTYLEQSLKILDANLSAVENLMKFNDSISATGWRNLLGQLRIRGDLSTLAVKHLSGGEKLKVILLGISHAKTTIHLLLLDEPENHLDIESKDLLANAIQNFNGAVILVSHDLEFVKNCGIKNSYSLTE